MLDLLVDLVVTLPEARSMVPLRDPKDLRLLSFRQASPFKRAYEIKAPLKKAGTGQDSAYGTRAVARLTPETSDKSSYWWKQQCMV